MIRAHYPSQDSTLPDNPPGLIELWQLLRRQALLIVATAGIGVLIAAAYCYTATRVYQSDATILVTKKSPHVAQISATGDETQSAITEDTLATHMEILLGSNVIARALRECGMDQAPSILSSLEDDETPVEYVNRNLTVTKGGDGGSRLARVIKVSFRHTSAEDCQTILNALIHTYDAFLADSKKNEMEEALTLLENTRDDFQDGLQNAQTEYQAFRERAPLLWHDSESKNEHLDRLTRLEEQLTQIRLEFIDVRSRLAAMQAGAAEAGASKNHYLQRLAMIDPQHMKQIELLIGVHNDGTSNERQGVANAEFEQLLQYRIAREELMTRFGADHPEVRQTTRTIQQVKNLIDEKKKGAAAGLNPELLMQAYVSSLRSKLAELKTRGYEIKQLRDQERARAKALVQYETKHDQLYGEVQRRRELFSTVFARIDEIETARDYNGFITDVIQSVELGDQVSPKLSLILMLGSLLGGALGAGIGVIRDHSNRTANASKPQITTGNPDTDAGRYGLNVDSHPISVSSERS